MFKCKEERQGSYNFYILWSTERMQLLCLHNTDPDQFHYIQGGAHTHCSFLHVLYLLYTTCILSYHYYMCPFLL